jgi:hypothetical protein
MLQIVCRFKPTLPVYTRQFARTSQVAANTAGIDINLVPHDIRRGAARDTSRLPSTGTQDVEGGRQLLGHSYQTMLSGVTDEYIGPLTTSTWEQRRTVEPDRDFDLLVDERMTIPHPRRRRIDSLGPLLPAEQGSKRKGTTPSTTSIDDIDEDYDPDFIHDVEPSGDTSFIGMLGWNTSSNLIDKFVSPDLQQDECFTGSVGANLEILGLDIDLRTSAEKQRDPDISSHVDLLDLNSLDFLRRLSTINITTKLSDETLDEGNSRDAPTSYMHRCAVTTECEYENENLAHMRIHEAGCTPAKEADAIYKRKSLGHSRTIFLYVATGKNPARNLAEYMHPVHEATGDCT